tara:strand:- start:19518 stop:19967 length:450 start_codon:yes stop_codon:yes gene_type:complete
MAVLTDSPASIVKQYLIDESAGVDPVTSSDDWPIFVGTLPDDENVKDKALAVFDTSARKDGRDIETGETFEHFGVQVLIRSNNYVTGWARLKLVMDKLDVALGTSVIYNSTTYKLVNSSRTSFFVLGTEADKRRRETFSVNSLVAIAET